MFTFHNGSAIFIFLLYVDDIVLMGNFLSLIQSFIRMLGLEFELKDLGKLNYFFGVEVSYLDTSLQLSHIKYQLELLKRGNMLKCKPCLTPIAVKTQLSTHSVTPIPDATVY